MNITRNVRTLADIEAGSTKTSPVHLSCQEKSFHHQFMHEYDLNVLVVKHSKGEQIERIKMDFRDVKMLQLFMQQLKQFLLMLQSADDTNTADVLRRYDVLKIMWFLDEIYTDLERLVA